MDAPSTAHPPTDRLRAFGLGQLEAAEAKKVAEHLDRCRDCSETIAGLEDDTFVSLVRQSPGPLAHQQAEFQATIDSNSGVAGDVVTLAELPAELRQHPRYEIVELIGRGGMGDVYKAQHKVMNRTVALKVIRPEFVKNAAAVDRFQREVQAAARLNHANIVTAYDAEQAGNLHFLVMEFVDGVDLSQVVHERGALPVAEACEFVRQAAVGLEHARQLNMVHRDIKPHNLMLAKGQESRDKSQKQDDEGATSGSRPSTLDSRPSVKILDFGLANFASEVVAEAASDDAPASPSGTVRSLQQLTQMGTMMGTPDYIAPEQATDARTADIRSDIYSLGCTLTFLLTRKPLFETASVADKLKAHAEQPPPKLTDTRGDIPRELQQVVDRMLAKDPAQRFQTPAELAEALAPFVVPAAPPPRRRSRTLVTTALVGAAILLAGLIVIATGRGRLEIQSEVDDVQVSVEQGGEQVAIIDLKTGSQVKWLPTGSYELKLVGGENDITLDQRQLTMSRLGKVIVTARWNTEGLGTLDSFNPPAEPITQDGVEVADGGWKITAAETRTVRLFEAPLPPLAAGPFFYRAKLKTENVKDRAFLEMWVRFPGEGEFFSKGFHNAVSGTNGWAEYEIPFFLKKGQQPDLAKLNLTIEGSGTVWIKDIQLRGRQTATPVEPASVPGGTEQPADSGRLKGKWVPVSASFLGKPLTDEQLARMAITLEGDRAELVDPDSGQSWAGTFTVNADRMPKHITFLAPDSKEQVPGIFEFDGQRLKLAWIDGDYARPTDFSPNDQPDHMTGVFERAPLTGSPLGPTEREALKAAEAYLAVIDEGRFGQLRDMVSSLAKQHVTREQVSQTYQKLRDTFGKATHRTLNRVQVYDEFPGLPAGRYAGVQYKTDFERQKELWESLLLNVDTDGQWRVNTYANTLEPMPFPETKKDPVIEQKLQAATSAAQDWLKLVDAGNYGESWEASAKINRDGIGKEKMIDAYKELFQPLGAIKSRTFKSSEYTTQMPQAPVGEYAVIQFNTQFVNQRIIETVVLTKEPDGHWRVAGYRHAEDNSPPTPPPATSKPPQRKTGLLTNPPKLPPEGVPVGRNLIVDPSLEETPTGGLPNGWFAWLDDGPDFKCEVFDDLEVIAYDRDKLPENFDAKHGRNNQPDEVKN